VNLSWNDCGIHGATNEQFACDTNVGFHTLVGSFVAPPGITALSGNEMTLDLQSASAELPDWWRVRNSGTCRPAAMSVSFDFTSFSNCLDFWAGQAVGGFAYDIAYGLPNRARVRILCAVPLSLAGPVAAGTEIYSFIVRVNNSHSVGADSCGGCTIPGVITLSAITLYQAGDAPDIALQTPSSRNIVSWQGPLGAAPLGTTLIDRLSWGQVKALYRPK
jgi:hypothetical protein